MLNFGFQLLDFTFKFIFLFFRLKQLYPNEKEKIWPCSVMFTRYQICRYLNCVHNLIIYVGFSLRVDRAHFSLYEFHPVQCVFSTVGDIMSTLGGVQYHGGGGGGEEIFTIVTLVASSCTVWIFIHV